MSKYGNKLVTVNGLTFQSQAESRRYGELKLLERAEKIRDVRVHPSFRIQEGFISRGRNIQPITYIADFSYTEAETGELVVEDVKGRGVVTPAFLLKQKLFLRKFPQIDLRIVWV